MTDLVRFGISIDKKLLDKFDRYIKDKDYPNRSEAFRDLIRETLIKKECLEGHEVTGAIILVYNHHKRELVNKLTDIQHNYHGIVLSSQHIHLDGDNCLEIIAVKGNPGKIINLANNLKSTKGVKHGALTMTTTGKDYK